jgi:hypothetical protein
MDRIYVTASHNDDRAWSYDHCFGLCSTKRQTRIWAGSLVESFISGFAGGIFLFCFAGDICELNSVALDIMVKMKKTTIIIAIHLIVSVYYSWHSVGDLSYLPMAHLFSFGLFISQFFHFVLTAIVAGILMAYEKKEWVKANWLGFLMALIIGSSTCFVAPNLF